MRLTAHILSACILGAFGLVLGCGSPQQKATQASEAAETETLASAAAPEAASASCYLSARSVLSRSPNSPAPGPQDLRGWIVLDRTREADSGQARLVDSDARALGASWRRIAQDSLLVTGFDDFLRVEMHLAAGDSTLKGQATAHSDAAQERDSTGRIQDYRRQWSVAARRASCDQVPSTASAR